MDETTVLCLFNLADVYVKWTKFDEASAALDDARPYMKRDNFSLKLKLDVIKLQAQVSTS